MLGRGLFLSSVYMDMTIPGVQKPHWLPWLLASLCWTACSLLLALPIPSTVVTARPGEYCGKSTLRWVQYHRACWPLEPDTRWHWDDESCCCFYQSWTPSQCRHRILPLHTQACFHTTWATTDEGGHHLPFILFTSICFSSMSVKSWMDLEHHQLFSSHWQKILV